MNIAADKWEPGRDKQGNATIIELQAQWPDTSFGERSEQIEARRAKRSVLPWVWGGGILAVLLLFAIGLLVVARRKKAAL